MPRKTYTKYILAVTLVMFGLSSMSGQHLAPRKPVESGETIQLFSDRYLYCVSEKLFFSAFYKQPSQIVSSKWSTVLYAELLRWDGTKLAQQKVQINNGFAEGFLAIPENIKSGNYYLRVYTRWMRNYSPYTYSYIPIKIINPLVGEIDEGPEENESPIQIINVQESNISENIIFSGMEKTYKTRQLVEFDISMLGKQMHGPYCISVALSENHEKTAGSIGFSGYEHNDTIKEIVFLPEIKDISLSGKIIDQVSQKPLSGERIILTSTINPFYFSNVDSDSSGDFLFSIPEFIGSHQFCLTAFNNDINNVEFLIRSDFCNQVISLPYIPFDLNKEEKHAVKELISNAQLFNKYSNIPEAGLIQENYLSFYGSPQSTTYIKDYIELIDLKEFFFELIPDVSIKYKDRKPYLRLIDMSSLSIFYPLVLFDNIPVPNDESLLSISNRNIDRIEVINGGYIIGKNMYSGIISIYSNKGDLAGMDLQSHTKFFNYILFSNNDHSFPDYSKNSISRVADTRNLLYWSPNIDLSDEATQKIRFYTSDATGEYTVTLRGIGESGNSIVYGQSHFTVE